MFRRSNITPREDWQAKVEMLGLTFHTNDDGSPYWDESVCYRFEKAEAETIRDATREIHRIAMLAVDHVIRNPRLIVERFGLPQMYVGYLTASWLRRDPTTVGRLDLAYDPKTNAVKLIEYNADASGLILEMQAQREWKDDFIPTAKQLNSLDAKLRQRYAELYRTLPDKTIHFASLEGHPTEDDPDRNWSSEEFETAMYLKKHAIDAGFDTHWMYIGDVQHNQIEGLIDPDFNQIKNMVKLYPWDFTIADDTSGTMLEDRTRVIEPVWTTLLSNKALLAILWELFPGHPNLLPTFFGDTDDLTLNDSGNYFVKPITSRWGMNIRYVRNHEVVETTDGRYADNPLIYQAAGVVPQFDGQHVVIGSFLVGGQPAGMILRESTSAIVTGEARVVPHYVMEW
jgi:glutathionylspermidine synthase